MKKITRIFSFLLVALLLCTQMPLAFATEAQMQDQECLTLTLYQQQIANIVYEKQIVYFSFTPTETEIYRFTSYSDLDTFCYLYDAEMNEIDSDDDGGNNLNFMIVNQLNAGETYYFAVKYYSVATGEIPVMLAKRSDVASIVVDPIEIVEGTGSWRGHLDENDNYVENSWMYYDEAPKNITVTFMDGSTITGDCWDIERETDVSAYCVSNQSYENQWGPGDHTATLYLGGLKIEYTVTITESSIESVVVDPIEYVEGAGTWYEHWDENGDYVEYSYMHYDAEPQNITVTFKDGSTVTGNRWEIQEATGIWLSNDYSQSYENQWGPGDHTVTFLFGHIKSEYTVSITEGPIKSITVDPLILIEKKDVFNRISSDENGELCDPVWFKYPTWPENITIYYKDDTSITCNFWEIEEKTGINLVNVYSNQTFENPWGVGNHTATISIGNIQTEFTVCIEENPVLSIDVGSVTCRENFDGQITNEWGDENYNYFEYSIEPDLITIHYKNGTSISGTADYIYEQTGIEPCFYSQQSYSNQWSIGTYSAMAEFYGITTKYTVSVVEGPIESIVVDPIEIIEGKGYWDNEGYWDENGDYIGGVSYMYYDEAPRNITVTFKDGSTISGNRYEIEEEIGILGQYDSDQSYENQWGPGNHTATFYLGKFTVEYTITIKESPIESVTIAPIEIIEGTGYWQGEWDWDENGNYVEIDKWMYYDVEPENITVTFKDGSTVSGDRYEIEEKTGFWMSYDYGQSYENQFKVGDNTETFYLGHIKVEFTVKITPTPIQSLEIFKNPDKTEYIQGEYFNLKGATIRIKYNDGSFEDFNIKDDYIFSGNFYQFVYSEKIGLRRGIDVENTFFDTVGQQSVTLQLFGKSCEIPVNVKENTINNISIKENANKSIVITITNTDNSTYDATVLGFDHFWRNDDGYFNINTAIITDKGAFEGVVYDDEDSFAMGIIGNDGEIVNSNTISHSEWFEVAEKVQHYSWEMDACYGSNLLEHEHYFGSVTADNIEDILTLAIEMSENCEFIDWYLPDGPDGLEYMIFDGDDVRNAVCEIFGIENIDLSSSKYYDASTDRYITPLFLRSGGGYNYTYDEITYENGVWSSKSSFPIGNGNTNEVVKTIYLTLDNECKIVAYDIGEKHIHSYDNACDTTCPCGYVRTVPHDYKPTFDTNNHFDKCTICDDVINVKSHEFENACDTTCDCGYTRTITHNHQPTYDVLNHYDKCIVCNDVINSQPHKFDNACDTTCDCGYTRAIIHDHQPTFDANNHFDKCTVCDDIINVKAHEFENACDTSCDCGYTRTITHDYQTSYNENKHYKECTVCHDIINITSHSFENDCDTTCNCGYIREITHDYKAKFDTNNHFDKCTVCGDVINKKPHKFDNDCDTTCNCGFTRTTSHKYDNEFDAFCNVCNAERTVSNIPAKKFSDVTSNAWYKQFVDYAVAYGLFSGTSDTTFSPNADMTRAQFVQVLANIAGVKLDNNVSTGFSDAPAGKWFTGAVKWATSNGIASGVGNGQFNPTGKIDRQQMCMMLVNYVENYKKTSLKEKVSYKTFADDKDIAGWAKTAVIKCFKAGLVSGTGNNKFSPKVVANRATGATIFTNFHKEYIA